MDPLAAGLDPSTVQHLRELGGDAFVERLVGLLLEQGSLHVATIAEAARTGDTDGARRAAHTLRSTAGTVGARALLAAAEQVETLAGAGAGPEEIVSATAALEAEWSGLKQRLT